MNDAAAVAFGAPCPAMIGTCVLKIAFAAEGARKAAHDAIETCTAMTTQPVEASARLNVSTIPSPSTGQTSAPPRLFGTNNEKILVSFRAATHSSVNRPCFSP